MRQNTLRMSRLVRTRCISPRYRPGLSTDKWLEFTERQHRLPPATSSLADDIITVDNIHKFVEPPRAPDTFTVNVESALNF